MSVNTSLSLWCNSRASVGRNCRTTLNLGGGFLFLHRLDKVHVMFLRKPAYWQNKIYHKWKDDYECGWSRFFLSEELLFFFFGDVRNIYIGSPSSAACHNYFSFFNRFAIYFCLLDFITIAAYLYITRVLLRISRVAI